ncbi:LysR family transcriptional regulator [Brachyspira sp.]|uniref:LysR family transcriptional regulator n=1 Tax=Brachyspira sp. TaxID=1977261 RepID=UPI003D7DA5F8
MEIRALKYFLVSAREGSITKAANSLGLTQPNLSRQINFLERDIGKKLFNRSNYKIELTDEGALFKRRAEEIIDMVEKTRAEFKSGDKIIAGNIRIGGGETYAIELITKIMRNIQKENPNIQYHVYSGNSEDVAEKLDKGLLDFGIFIEPAGILKYDYIKIPAKDTWGVLMRKDSKLAKKQFVTKNDLINLPLILSRQPLYNRPSDNKFLEWFQSDFDKVNIVATYNLIYNASIMVKSGIGYAVCLDKLINTNGSSLCFVPLKPKLESELNIVWKKGQVFSPAGRIFLDTLYKKFSV